MPPPKKYSYSLKISLSDFDAYLLEHLARLANNSMADQIREAIVVYARQLRGLDVPAFRTGALGWGMQIGDDEREKAFWAKVNEFAPPATAGKRDDEPTLTGVPPIAPLSASPSDFPEED